MGENSKIEWTESNDRHKMRAREGVVTTFTALTTTRPDKEGHAVAVSSLSFRAYVSKLTGRKLGAFKRAASLLGMAFDDYVGRIEAGEKNCIDCRQWKRRSSFNTDASRWDGLCSKCQSCSSSRGIASYEPVHFDDMKFGPTRNIVGGSDRARNFINEDVAKGRRPNPNDLHCALCGHKGSERRHEYHHHMGYTPEHVFDVVALCTTCHHGEHAGNISRDRNSDGTFTGRGC